MHELWANAPSVKKMHDFLEISVMIFSKKMMMVFVCVCVCVFFLMHETWANAPSLEHECMILKKTWFDQSFSKTTVQVMIF